MAALLVPRLSTAHKTAYLISCAAGLVMEWLTGVTKAVEEAINVATAAATMASFDGIVDYLNNKRICEESGMCNDINWGHIVI
jgi:hypothetical protein